MGAELIKDKGHREEVINTCLAILMARHGVDAEAETIRQSGKQRPDVLFTLGGLRTVIEGKYADVADADKVVSGDAERRVSSGICHIAVAVVYPRELRAAGTKDLGKILADARLRYRIFSEARHNQWLRHAFGDSGRFAPCARRSGQGRCRRGIRPEPDRENRKHRRFMVGTAGYL
ncbi:MAG: hypothetical protein LBR95_08880 [Azoarcus sp.]|jgi:hypothetical protein|nr:hypothetical protein [Azoarcus sp.]